MPPLTTRPRAVPLSRPAGRQPARRAVRARASPPVVEGDAAAQLKAGIADFYDESSGLWEDMWGEHMHHGLYRASDPPGMTNQQAQIAMIDAVLEWARVTSVKRMADIGCGIGGSSRHVARAFPGAVADGITLSPVQAARGNALAEKAGLGDRTKFKVGDALAPPLPPASYDLVWSLESGEHMPDKRAFVSALTDLAAPGGKVVIVTWVHRDLAPGEARLPAIDRALLAAINRAYYLPPWCSAADYVALMQEAGLKNVRRDDWSDDVAPFWGRVVASALTPRGIAGLAAAGGKTVLGALAMPLMAAGFRRGSIRFALLVGEKA